MSLDHIGRYELLKSLAVGGMAEVFLARQTSVQGFEKVLVIKKILPHLASQERFVQMFLDEARLAARFNHPNIVQIFDLGQDQDVFFIAMEYIHGEDIKSLVRRCAKKKQRIPNEHIVKIFSGVMDGLHYAHQQTDLDGKKGGIVHRDVSPHNIIVSFEGGVKLVDFGIAKARSEISTTIPGRVKGKHAYMSPEQCRGMDIDGRSDVFSAGVVMYELLTWTRLFKRKSDLDTLKAVAAGDVRPPQSVSPEIDAELQDIVMRALAPNKDDRYQTAQEMQMALDDYLLAKSLKSNSIFISRFMADMFADKLEARNRALEHAKAANLEGAVLAAKDEGPDLVAFLDMFFGDAGSGSDSTGETGRISGTQSDAGPEFTPSSEYTPAGKPGFPGSKMKRTDPVLQISPDSGRPPPKAPPPKPPPGMELLHDAPVVSTRQDRAQPGQSPFETEQPDSLMSFDTGAQPAAEIVDPLAGERLAGEPDPYADEIMPAGKRGKGFLVLVFLVLAVLAGGLIYMFRDTEQTSNAPKTGRVEVKSIPSGADVYYDDSRLPSQTPTEIGSIEPAVEHTLKVSLPGLPAWEKKFTLTDTRKPLFFEAVLSKGAALKARMSGAPIIAGADGKGFGEIQVKSKPPRALIYLDGISTGKKTPSTLSKVAAGLDHVILLEKKGMQSAFERFKLTGGQTIQLDLSLQVGADEARGRLLAHVESEPEGAKVTVNGYPLSSKTPLAVKMLAKDVSELEVEMKGYKTWKRTVRPVPGVDLTFFAKLKK
ncbi:MAG TPA: serine/threonine-protein kinase [Myxococcota bacterium]|nr:serine/threonine-protein kinase [Myxococcota bacterium]